MAKTKRGTPEWRELRSPSGVEVIELDGPDGRRWEKRATRGALALVIETTRDLAEARRWVETIRGYMNDEKRYENHPEDGSAA